MTQPAVEAELIDPLCSWHCSPLGKHSHGSKGTNFRDRVQLFTQQLYFKVGEGWQMAACGYMLCSLQLVAAMLCWSLSVVDTSGTRTSCSA